MSDTRVKPQSILTPFLTPGFTARTKSSFDACKAEVREVLIADLESAKIDAKKESCKARITALANVQTPAKLTTFLYNEYLAYEGLKVIK
jgi:hypothetical protein